MAPNGDARIAKRPTVALSETYDPDTRAALSPIYQAKY
jgi:hypothetical protein